MNKTKGVSPEATSYYAAENGVDLYTTDETEKASYQNPGY